MKCRICVSLAIVMVCLGRNSQAGTTNTWDTVPGAVGAGNGEPDDGPGIWDTTSGNWTSDGGANNVVWPNNTTDIAEFNGRTGGTITVNESLSAGGLLFSGSGTNSYTFSGAGTPVLTLGSGGITISNTAGAQTFDNTLTFSLGTSQIWNNDGGGMLAVGGTISMTSPSLSKTGVGGLILNGVNNLNTSDSTSGSGLNVDGGGSMTIGGQTIFLQSNTGRVSPPIVVGGSSTGNTLTITGRLLGGSISVGGGTSGNNSLRISGPGNSANPTVRIGHRDTTLTLGFSSCGNTLTISDGAYVWQESGTGGYTNDKIGQNAGATNNSFTVTGVNEVTGERSVFRNSGQRFYVGEAGSSNTLTVSNGGQMLLRVFHVSDTGNNNAVIITGSGSYLSATEDMFVGGGVGGTNNSVTVSNGGRLNSQTRNGKVEVSCIIGANTGANNNSITITGTDSTWTDNGYHVVIGGSGYTAYPAYNWMAAINNSLNVISGGSATINTGVILSGVNSTFNLGDGTNISSAAVGSARDGGISLSVTDARLNFNSGRLVANVDGVLVSGAGKIQLTGPAYFSTTYSGSTIDCEITGTGSLTKEGSGTLTLFAFNTYTGDTILTKGTLEINQRCLGDKADVYLVTGSTMKLNFAGEDVIGGLYHDGKVQPQGVYGTGDLDGAIGGTTGGSLRVTKGPAQSGFSLIVR